MTVSDSVLVMIRDFVLVMIRDFVLVMIRDFVLVVQVSFVLPHYKTISYKDIGVAEKSFLKFLTKMANKICSLFLVILINIPL